MRIFLSAVSAELKECRNALASDLRAVGADVVVQEDFQQHGWTLMEKLEEYIAGCDRVIVLAGDAYGWEPPPEARPPGTPRRSYSQWEYFFAIGERLNRAPDPAKETFVYFRSPEYHPPAPIDEPVGIAALQQEFLEHIRARGKDRNTFASLHELRALVLRDGFRLGGETREQPELKLELFPLDAGTRFFYGAERVRVVGRDQELKALQAFLDSPPSFQWWLISGPAGAGKSRTTLELCRRNQQAWHAGWLFRPRRFDQWETWQPDRPTLMVLDDAAAQIDAARDVILALARRAQPPRKPVRVLLLERDGAGKWLDRFTGSGGERHALDATRFGDPLELGGLQEADLWELIRHIVEREGGKLPDRKRTLAGFRGIDPRQRPLFAIFAADAIVAGREVEQWDRTELLASVLKGEMEKRWEPAGVTREDKNLLALASIAGDLPLTILKNPPVEGFLPRPKDYSPQRYGVVSGRPARDSAGALLPSVLGEFFVLVHLQPASSLDDRAELARTAAIRLESSDADGEGRTVSYSRFFEQAARNFPGHPSLLALRTPPPESRDAVFNWGIDAANLIDSLDDEANLGLCRAIWRDLRQAAFGTEKTGLATIRLRTAQAAATLILRSVNSDLPGARALYSDLRALAGADEDLRQAHMGGGAALVLALAHENATLQEAEKLYQELKAASKDGARGPLGMAAGGLVCGYARRGDLATAKVRYEELRAWADSESAASEGRRRSQFKVQDDGLFSIRFGEASFVSELRTQQAKSATALIAAYASASELSAARAFYDELKTLAAAHAAIPAPSENKPAGLQALVAGLAMGVLDLGFRQLGGKNFTLFPDLKQKDAGPSLRERQAQASNLLIDAYADAGNLDEAAGIYEDLRGLGALSEAGVLPHWGSGAYRIFRGYGYHANMPMAWTMFEQLVAIRAAHGDKALPLDVCAHACFTLITVYRETGDHQSAREVAAESAHFLEAEDTKAAIGRIRGAESFYEYLQELGVAGRDTPAPEPTGTA